ncbi:MAG: helix-turn-helix domain-containing protein [Clostridiales bacterium]|nr:helix-turn-helix domain-containing protein [Clostridiales bacterium]
MALSTADLNNSATTKLLKHKRRATCFSHTTTEKPPKASLCKDDFGELCRTGLIQNQKRLTDAEAASIVEEYQNGQSTYSLAKKYGCHRNTISRCLKKHGTTVRIGNAKTIINDAEMIALYNKGVNTTEIAKRFGITPSTVIRHLHANGVEMRTRWDYGK